MDSRTDTYPILLWGFGHMNKVVIKYAQEKGHTIVGVIGHHDIGKDAGEVAEIGAINVKISDEKDAVEVITKTKPRACILATRSTMADLAPTLRTLGSLGVNTITIGEEAFYAWNTSPKLSEEIDTLFKANNATFSGTGYQDVFWGYLATVVVGCTHKATKLECFTQYNVDDYGRALCEAHGVGLSKEEFAKNISENATPAYVWNSNEWICSALGWKIKKTSQVLLPTTADKEINSKSYGKTIPAGTATGMKAIVTTETEQGVTIETTMIGQVYYDDLEDVCSWTISGTPSTSIVSKKPDTVGITCASAVNRLKQLVESAPGYVTTDKFGPILYKH